MRTCCSKNGRGCRAARDRPAAALNDCRASPGRESGEDAPTSGVFIGLGLDPNTTNFNLRWSVLASGGRKPPVSGEQGAYAPRSPDQASPPLSANRTMGALG